jgi:hypothetical protein
MKLFLNISMLGNSVDTVAVRFITVFAFFGQEGVLG